MTTFTSYCALAVLLAASPASAQAPRATAFPAAPVIDGSLDEAVWSAAARLEGFVQTRPGDNIAPSRWTRILIGFDSEAIYLGIEALDDSAAVRATVALRDRVTADDHVSILLDTFGDRRRGYVFAFNPLGIQQDGVFTEGIDSTDYSVDVVMRSAGRLHRGGWTVEVAIPLSSLRYASTPGVAWAIQAHRRIKHLDDEQNSWQPVRRGMAGVLAQAGVIEGFDLLPARRSIELIPSLTGLQSGSRVPPDVWQERDVRPEVGLTATLVPAPGVTAAAAINPDFAQVEADAPVVTQNLRFPVFYEEKRPFFLEAVAALRTPLTVVHTRAIADPLAALRFTGKRSATSFGLLAASDEAPGFYSALERTNPALQPEIARYGGRNSLVGIARLQRELGAASRIGVLGTAYHFVDRDNVTAGVDGRLARGARFTASFELTGTWARQPFFDPDIGTGSVRTGKGLGFYTQIRRTGRHLNLTLTGRGRSPDWVAASGFTSQTNTNTWIADARWDSDQRQGRTIIGWSASHTLLVQSNWDGMLTYAYSWPQLHLTLPRLTTISAGPYVDYIRVFEEEFGAKRSATQAGAFFGEPVRRTIYHGGAVSATTTPARQWTISGSMGVSYNFFDYDFGGGPRYPRVSPAALADPNAPLDPGPGTAFGSSLDIAFRPGASLRLNGSVTTSRLRRNDTGRLAHNEQLWSAQGAYQVSRFLFVRLRADYTASRSNVRPQLLLAFTPSPGTSLYAGYNDDLNADGFSPITGQKEAGVHRNARIMFVKVSYLLRRSLR